MALIGVIAKNAEPWTASKNLRVMSNIFAIFKFGFMYGFLYCTW